MIQSGVAAMSLTDGIALLTSLITLGGLIIGLRTLGLLRRQVDAQIQQMEGQNKLLSAQLLKDRFDMYRTTSQPVTDEELGEFRRTPREYIDLRRYGEFYVGNDEKCKRYIYMSHVYEYLAFTHQIRMLGLPDPLGSHWLELWVGELKDEPEFQDVATYYEGYYPDFADFVRGAPVIRAQSD
jgi:hypothetical protein